MVGEPTTFTKAWFDAWPDAADATPLLAAARAIKTAQELERIRLANEIAAAAMEHVPRAPAARDEGERGRRDLAGLRPRRGHRLERARSSSRSASRSSGRAPGSRRSPRPATGRSKEDEPTLFEIWVCADGYWGDHTKNLCPGELRAEYRELEAALLDVYDRAVDHCRPGASLAELDRLVRDGIAEAGYPGQPTHPDRHGVGARAHEPPYAHQAGGGEIEEGMVLAIEPGCYWDGGGGLRVEDNFLITADGAEKLSPFPDGVVRARLIWTGALNDPYASAARVGLYDTTLRDGEQTVGVVLDPEQKLEIARLLDELGIDRIEAGFPRVSDDDWRRRAS